MSAFIPFPFLPGDSSRDYFVLMCYLLARWECGHKQYVILCVRYLCLYFFCYDFFSFIVSNYIPNTNPFVA